MTLLLGVSPDSLWVFLMSVDTEGTKLTKRFTELSKRSGLLATHIKSVHRISFKTQRRSL